MYIPPPPIEQIPDYATSLFNTRDQNFRKKPKYIIQDSNRNSYEVCEAILY